MTPPTPPSGLTLEQAEALVKASADHRLLKRIPATELWPTASITSAADVRRAAFLDVETTGLDPEADEVIELAIVPFDYNPKTGEVLSIRSEEGLFSFREPSFPIPEAGRLIHGISDEDVAGCAIDESAIEATLAPIQLIIAHNAGFDRPMVEKHWRAFETKAWACSLTDVDWRAAGMGAAKLDYLLMRFGWFFEAHRARGDAEAGVFLLSQILPNTGTTVLASLLEKARAQTFLIRATGAPFEARALLKRRGYRWDPGGANSEKAWFVITTTPEAEIEWLRSDVFGRAADLEAIPITARERYSGRHLKRP